LRIFYQIFFYNRGNLLGRVFLEIDCKFFY
jgi:hypothetical protein